MANQIGKRYKFTFSRFMVNLISILFLYPLYGTSDSLAKPGCQEKCGNITIPFPFGVGKGCSLDKSFELECNKSLPYSPLQFKSGLFSILNVSLNYLRVFNEVRSVCYLNTTLQLISKPWEYNSGFSSVHHSSFSHTKNKFIAIGYDVFAFLTESGSTNYTSGCASLGDINESSYVASYSCIGIGCCEISIPRDMSSFVLRIYSMHDLNNNYGAVMAVVCTTAFITDKDFYGYSKYNVSEYQTNSFMVPVVLNWRIGNVTCKKARERRTYVCGNNSDCIDSTGGLGYQCQCLSGYQGNPYLPSGCQDVNECKDSNSSVCQEGAICINTQGSYLCVCPSGYHGDDSGHGYRCKRLRHSLAEFFLQGLATAAGFLVLFSTIGWLYHKFKKRKKTIVKQKHFKRNGGLLMQQQISSNKGSVMKTKLYSIEELEKATDNFNQSRVLGRGGHGTVYKGMLPDGSIVAVKKSNVVHEQQVDQFINEVLILSQIDHRNIVKLLGCCLESEVPLLVYEYVSNGTLSLHLHDESFPTIPWENRLQIAQEVAGALAYLHSYASTAIFHRDIKSSNILLDENYRAVVSDFGISRSIPLYKTHLTTLVGGTFGYLDPDYFRSGQFTDKSDVYSFGVVIAELITGRKVPSPNSSDEGLVIQFRSVMKRNLLFEMLALDVNELQKGEIILVAQLAMRCLKSKAKKRPSMIEVAMDLNRLIQDRAVINKNFKDK